MRIEGRLFRFRSKSQRFTFLGKLPMELYKIIRKYCLSDVHHELEMKTKGVYCHLWNTMLCEKTPRRYGPQPLTRWFNRYGYRRGKRKMWYILLIENYEDTLKFNRSKTEQIWTGYDESPLYVKAGVTVGEWDISKHKKFVGPLRSRLRTHIL